MSYSLDSIAERCYPNSSTLVNKLGITDENELNKYEALLTYAKATFLDTNPIEGFFDFIHYKKIHRFLFEDIYEWAGEIRTVNMSKKGIKFCDINKIEERANLIFKRLKNMDFFRNLEHSDFVSEIVDFYCSINSLHPFREGNGRTQRIFLTQLIRFAGYQIKFSKIDTDFLMIATIQAANGVEDLLREIFMKTIMKEG